MKTPDGNHYLKIKGMGMKVTASGPLAILVLPFLALVASGAALIWWQFVGSGQ